MPQGCAEDMPYRKRPSRSPGRKKAGRILLRPALLLTELITSICWCRLYGLKHSSAESAHRERSARLRGAVHDVQDSVALRDQVRNLISRDVGALLLHHAQEVRDLHAGGTAVRCLVVGRLELIDDWLCGAVRQVEILDVLDEESNLLVGADDVHRERRDCAVASRVGRGAFDNRGANREYATGGGHTRAGSHTNVVGN